MNEIQHTQAQPWLDQLIVDLERDPEYRKSGEDLLFRISWEIKQYSQALRESIQTVILDWLFSNNQKRVSTALGLIFHLRLVNAIPNLERLRQTMREGCSDIPIEWLTSIEGTINYLLTVQMNDDKPFTNENHGRTGTTPTG